MRYIIAAHCNSPYLTSASNTHPEPEAWSPACAWIRRPPPPLTPGGWSPPPRRTGPPPRSSQCRLESSASSCPPWAQTGWSPPGTWWCWGRGTCTCAGSAPLVFRWWRTPPPRGARCSAGNPSPRQCASSCYHMNLWSNCKWRASRIQYKCLVPIYVFPKMKLLFPKQKYNVLSSSS